METEDVNYLVWVRNNTKQIEDSEEVVYKGSICSIADIKDIYQKLCITEVDVFGYNNFFTIEIRDETFYSLQEAINYVSEHIIDTASVVRIRQKKVFGDIIGNTIENPNYIPPTKIDTGRSDKYLKKKEQQKELTETKEQVLQVGESGADIEMVVLKNSAGIYFVHFNLFKMVENVRVLGSGSPMQCFDSIEEIHKELGSQMAGKKVTI